MEEHANVGRVRAGYKAFQEGDMDGVFEFFDEGILFHVPGNNPIAGDYKGRDEVLGFFGKLIQETGGTFKLEVHDILANDEHGVGLCVNSGERNGKKLSQNIAQVFNLNAEGKVVEFWGYPEDAAEVDEFWS
jgi:ketosteroid isomerase-like protein